MELKIKLANGKLEGKGLEGEQVNKVIEGFFSVLGATPATKIEVQKPIVTVQTTEPKKAVEAVKKAVENAIKPTESRPKVLPIVDSNKNMTHTPFEGLADKLRVNPKGEGDIRYTEDNTPLYRAHYWCPECGTNSKRYIRETSDYLKCHDCGTKIEVEESVPGEPLKQDKHGAYYIAREAFWTPENEEE